MNKTQPDMAQVLGRSLTKLGKEEIPGTTEQSGTEVIYVSIPKDKQVREVFRAVTQFTNPPFAQHGGVHEDGCTIETPRGVRYYSLRFRGDLSGWRKDIEAGAAAAGLSLASVVEQHLVLEDGERVLLNTCSCTFD